MIILGGLIALSQAQWIGIHGYDTQAKQGVSSWIDNLSTQIDPMTGRWNDVTQTLLYTGSADHPVEGKAHEGHGARRPAPLTGPGFGGDKRRQ